MTWDIFSPTQIVPPRVSVDLVERERIGRTLLQALGQSKLLLLCAPAGYGKTVALMQLLHRLPPGHAVAWISLREDDDLQRFVALLLAALDPYDLPWRISPQTLPAMAVAQGGEPAVAREILGALAAADVSGGLIAMDDVHRIADPRVFRFLDALLAQLPPQWSIAMTCRAEPPLALARLYAERALTELGPAELSFLPEEARALAHTSGAALSDADVQDWQHRTQGWPAAMVLGLTSGLGSGRLARTQAQRHIFGFLAQEVMSSLPQPMKQFLMRCSVLPQWTVDRCRHVSGDANAARWLGELQRWELFVTALDTEPLTLRLHDLFRDFLLERLRQELPAELPALFKRAAAHETDVVSRVGLLQSAGATADAVRHMMDAALPMIQAGAGEQLARLIASLPRELQDASPEIAFVDGLCAWHRWAYTTALASMQRALDGFERAQSWQLALKARAMAALSLINLSRATAARRLLAEAPQVAMEADTAFVWQMVSFVARADSHEHQPARLERMAELFAANETVRGWFSVVPIPFVLFVFRPGVVPAMQRLADLASRLAGDDAPYLRGRLLIIRAWLALRKADLPAARELAAEGLAEASWVGKSPALMVPLNVFRAADCQLRGNAEGARAILTELRDAASQTPQRRSDLLYSCVLGAFSTANGDWDTATQALERADGRVHLYDSEFVRVSSTVLRAELRLHDNQVEEAVADLRNVGPQAVGCDWWGLHARTCASWARGELRAGDVRRAWQALAPALEAAVASQEPLGLLLCGASALQELAQAPWPRDVQAPSLAMLKHCAALARELHGGGAPAPTAADGALTHRELEVLQLVAKGQSNKVIARELGLSPHTVKRHLARMLDKTGQSSRGRLAAWYLGRVEAEGG